MSANRPSIFLSGLSVASDAKIDALCDRFEAEWRADNGPDLEVFLKELTATEHKAGFQELLRVELEMRRERGDDLEAEDYCSRFNHASDLVQQVFSSLNHDSVVGSDTIRTESTATGSSPGLRLRCPHCHSPVELVSDASLVEIDCSVCGRRFSLVSGHSSDASSAEVRQLGHFQLLKRIGIGAFGEVWKAQDTHLDRVVAIKIPRKGQLDSEGTEKFFREARSAAQLQHPNIVPVYEVGRDGDSVFIVSELITGVTLSDMLSDTQLTFRETAEMLALVADALFHAHEAGVIHRDLKPQNVIIDDHNAPHLMDFGLAKREVGELTVTFDGAILGTPAYMSPEQAQGRAHDVDCTSDIYSLGVLMFQMLTGHLPFLGPPRMLIHKMAHEEAPSPRKLESRLPRDLETICLKCLEKKPEHRYQTAREVTDDLRNYLNHRPISAKPISRLIRGWRWCQRNSTAAILSACLLSVLLASAIIAPIVAARQATLRHRADQEALAASAAKDKARRSEEEAKRSRDSALWNLYVARQFPIFDACRRRDFGHLERMLDELVPAVGQPDFRGWEWAYYKHQCQQASMTIEGSCPAWHPTEQAIALFTAHADSDPVIELRSTKDASLIREIATVKKINPAEFMTELKWSADGKRLAYASSMGTTGVLDVESGKSLFNKKNSVHVWNPACVALSQDGRLLATGNWFGLIQLWNVDTGNRIRVFHDPENRFNLKSIALTPDATHLAASLRWGQRSTWNVKTGVQFDYSKQSRKNGFVAWNPSGDKFASTDADSFSIYKINQPEPIGTLPHQKIANVAWLDENQIVTSGYDHQIKVWDMKKLELVSEHLVHHSPVTSLSTSSDGQSISSYASGEIKVFDSSYIVNETKKLSPDMLGNNETGPHHLVWMDAGNRLASSHHAIVDESDLKSHLRIWDIDSEKYTHEQSVDSLVMSIGWNSTRSALLATTIDGRFIEFGLGSSKFKTLGKYSAYTNISMSSFSSDGRWLAFGNLTQVQLIDTTTQKAVAEYDMPDGVPCLRWSNNNKYVALGSWENVIIWEPLLKKPVANTGCHQIISCIAWSPNNKRIIVGQRNGALQVISTNSHAKLMDITGHTGIVHSVDWSVDGNRYATTSDDCTVKIWDTTTGEELLSFDHPNKIPFVSVKWSPNSRRLAAGDGLGNVFVWEATEFN